jgi:hypothetical protein
VSDTKLAPRSLNAEERAIVEEMVTRTGTDSGYVFTGDNAQFVGWHVEVEYAEAYAAAFQRILARHDEAIRLLEDWRKFGDLETNEMPYGDTAAFLAAEGKVAG